jgi:hypothetical protein
MQAAHTIERPTAADRQETHVEWLRGIVRTLPTERQQILRADALPARTDGQDLAEHEFHT